MTTLRVFLGSASSIFSKSIKSQQIRAIDAAAEYTIRCSGGCQWYDDFGIRSSRAPFSAFL